MRVLHFSLFAVLFLSVSACHPARPLTVSEKPVSINDIRTTQPLPPSKPLGEMSWTKFDGITNADGATETLKNLRGKAVVLDFWATNCPPCLEEIPHLRDIQAKYGKENIQVVGLHIGEPDDRRRVPAFAEKLKIDYTLGTPDNDLTAFIFADTDSIPQTAVFDRDGKLVEKFIGFGEQTKIDLDAAVVRAVGR